MGGTNFIGGSRATLCGVTCVDEGILGYLFLYILYKTLYISVYLPTIIQPATGRLG